MLCERVGGVILVQAGTVRSGNISLWLERNDAPRVIERSRDRDGVAPSRLLWGTGIARACPASRVLTNARSGRTPTP